MSIRPIESLSELRAQAERLGVDHLTIMSQANGLRNLKLAISKEIGRIERAKIEIERAKIEAELIEVKVNEPIDASAKLAAAVGVEEDQLNGRWPKVAAWGKKILSNGH